MSQQITITRPDDWHLHLRDGALLESTVPATARIMSRAIIMPNLQPPVMNAQQALEYRDRILKQSHAFPNFKPLMVIYLTDNTTPEMIAEAAKSGHVVAAKLYPAGATTNSDSGVTDLSQLSEIASVMAEHDMPLLVHGEVTDPSVDVFDREKRFLDEILTGLVAKVPTLRLVVEHITTKEAAQFVMGQSDNVGATITPQHLAYNRNHMLVGGIKPHYYCTACQFLSAILTNKPYVMWLVRVIIVSFLVQIQRHILSRPKKMPAAARVASPLMPQ